MTATQTRTERATVTVTVTYPAGMWDDPAAVVLEVLTDPSFGLDLADNVHVTVQDPVLTVDRLARAMALANKWDAWAGLPAHEQAIYLSYAGRILDRLAPTEGDAP